MRLDERCLVVAEKIKGLAKGQPLANYGRAGKFYQTRNLKDSELFSQGCLKKGIGKSKKLSYTSLGHKTGGE